MLRFAPGNRQLQRRALCKRFDDIHVQVCRAQLQQHREKAACAVCHVRMDALGFALGDQLDTTSTTGLSLLQALLAGSLLHVVFHDTVPAGTARQVLQGYDRRYDRLVDWVTETEGSFRDDRLSEVPIADLLILPVSESANLWRNNGER